MASGVQVQDVDRGLKAILKAVFGMKRNRPSVAVGITAANGASSQDGVTALDKGIWNEFGTQKRSGGWHVPPRSFVRAWFDENRAQAHRKLAGLMRQVLAGKIDEEKAFDRFGVWCTASMKDRIKRQVPPPNAESTVDRKGSSTPLIDTGHLRSAISYETRHG